MHDLTCGFPCSNVVQSIALRLLPLRPSAVFRHGEPQVLASSLATVRRPAVIRPHGPEHPMRPGLSTYWRRFAECVQDRVSMNTLSKECDEIIIFNSHLELESSPFVLIKYRTRLGVDNVKPKVWFKF